MTENDNSADIKHKPKPKNSKKAVALTVAGVAMLASTLISMYTGVNIPAEAINAIVTAVTTGGG